MTSPQVSVIMPVYNEQKYVSFAVESILNQKFRDFELIVIDDGSKDDTNSIIKSFEDSRITLVENDENLGTPNSLNFGIENASGNYIARMDADDICHPDRLCAQVDFLDANPDMMVVGSSSYHIDTRNRILSSKDMEIAPKLDVEYILNRGVPCLHPSIMMREHVIKRVGGYRTMFKRAQDLDFWLRLAEIFDDNCIHNLPERYLFYRKDGAQMPNIYERIIYNKAAVYAAQLRIQNLNESKALQITKSIDTEYLQHQPKNIQQACRHYSTFLHYLLTKDYWHGLKHLGKTKFNYIFINTLVRLFIRDLKIKFKW